eukprot:965573-Pelagomonas_calceolata.AAC.10
MENVWAFLHMFRLWKSPRASHSLIALTPCLITTCQTLYVEAGINKWSIYAPEPRMHVLCMASRHTHTYLERGGSAGPAEERSQHFQS